MSTNIAVIGVGSPLLDLLAQVDEAFLANVPGRKGGMEMLDAAGMKQLLARLPGKPVSAPGGSAANTIQGLAHLGLRTAFLGKLGRDDIGEQYCDGAVAAGVATSRFKVSDGTPTGCCLCLITPDAERTCRTHLGAAGELQLADVSVADFANCELAHLEGYMLYNQPVARAVFAAAKAADCLISLDLSSFEVVKHNHDLIVELLPQVDIVFANEAEAEAFSGSADPQVGRAALAKLCPAGAVKLGAAGALLWHGDEEVAVAAHRVTAIDTTGAGDLWAAGFLFGYLRGYELATCGHFGALTGAEVVQILGAVIPAHRWPVIREIIK